MQNAHGSVSLSSNPTHFKCPAWHTPTGLSSSVRPSLLAFSCLYSFSPLDPFSRLFYYWSWDPLKTEFKVLFLFFNSPRNDQQSSLHLYLWPQLLLEVPDPALFRGGSVILWMNTTSDSTSLKLNSSFCAVMKRASLVQLRKKRNFFHASQFLSFPCLPSQYLFSFTTQFLHVSNYFLLTLLPVLFFFSG